MLSNIKKKGLSLIITDQHSELNAILEELELGMCKQIDSQFKVATSTPDEIFYIPVDTLEEARAYLSIYNVSRCIVSIDGKREFIGSAQDFDWLKCSIQPKPAVKVSRLPTPMERDPDYDPFTEIGYRR